MKSSKALRYSRSSKYRSRSEGLEEVSNIAGDGDGDSDGGLDIARNLQETESNKQKADSNFEAGLFGEGTGLRILLIGGEGLSNRGCAVFGAVLILPRLRSSYFVAMHKWMTLLSCCYHLDPQTKIGKSISFYQLRRFRYSHTNKVH